MFFFKTKFSFYFLQCLTPQQHYQIYIYTAVLRSTCYLLWPHSQGFQQNSHHSRKLFICFFTMPLYVLSFVLIIGSSVSCISLITWDKHFSYYLDREWFWMIFVKPINQSKIFLIFSPAYICERDYPLLIQYWES